MSHHDSISVDDLFEALCAIRGDRPQPTRSVAAATLYRGLHGPVATTLRRSFAAPDELFERALERVFEENWPTTAFRGATAAEASTFLRTCVRNELLSLLRVKRLELTELNAIDERSLPTSASGLDARDELMALRRLYVRALLVAGETQRLPRVRAFLEHRLEPMFDTASSTPPSKSTAAVHQDRSTGLRYLTDIIEKNPEIFDDDDRHLLQQLSARRP